MASAKKINPNASERLSSNRRPADLGTTQRDSLQPLLNFAVFSIFLNWLSDQ